MSSAEVLILLNDKIRKYHLKKEHGNNSAFEAVK